MLFKKHKWRVWRDYGGFLRAEVCYPDWDHVVHKTFVEHKEAKQWAKEKARKLNSEHEPR